MRILYLCHRIPYPPDKGDKIRAFHQLRAIAAHHEVDVFTLADDAGDIRHQASLLEFCSEVTVLQVHPKMARLRALPFLFTNVPFTIPYFYSTELQAKVRKAVRQRSYDRIFVYCSAMAQYVDADCSIPVLTDLVDVDSDKWRQYAMRTTFPFSAIYWREWQCLRGYERKICERSARVFVTTANEARLVRQLSAAIRVEVISMGVDIDYFKPAKRAPQANVPTAIFTGDMSYYPNEDAAIFFASRVLPLIRQTVRDARFLIVGRKPTRKVRQLQRHEGVEITGYVPDVRPYLAQAHVSVAPFSIAAGIQSKILEALASGLPVVTTPLALQGLAEDVAQIIETGKSPEELAAKVVCLLGDSQLAHRLGMEGRQRVAESYNWDRNLGLLLDVIEDPSGTAKSSTLRKVEPR